MDTLVAILTIIHHRKLKNLTIGVSFMLNARGDDKDADLTFGTDWSALRDALRRCTQLRRLAFCFSAVSSHDVVVDTSLLQATVREELESWQQKGILEVQCRMHPTSRVLYN